MTPATELLSHAPTRPLIDPGQPGAITGTGITICSTAPIPRFVERRHSFVRPDGKMSSMTQYSLDPASRGSYRCLKVYDTYDWGYMWDMDGKHQLVPRPVPAMVVAQDLVSIWSQKTIAASAGFSLGIGIIRGDVPTPEELAHLMEQTRACCEWLVKDAGDKFQAGEWKNITDIHRLGADWMYGTGAQRLPWFRRMDLQETKACVACGETIDAKALKCKVCNTELIDFYAKYGIEPDVACQAVLDRRSVTATASSEPIIKPRPPLQPPKSL